FSPSDIIPIANSAVFDSGRSEINMTFFIGTFDFESKKLTYVNAGHCSPWLVRKAGDTAPAKARLLLGAGPRLGENNNVEKIEEQSVPIQENDMIIFYTDGLLEGKDKSGEQYGKKRARKLIEANFPRGDSTVLGALIKDFMGFNGDKPLDD